MDIFDFIRNKSDIFEVVSAYVDLKRAGGYLKGRCPFHMENDASFTISPSKQIYYCFGCKKSGDAIGFIAEKEKISQIQAAQFLAEKFKIQIPMDQLKVAEQKAALAEKQLYFTAYSEFLNWCVEKFNESSFAQKYVESRGITKQSCQKFEIGFFPSDKTSKNGLLKRLSQKSILISDLINFGIFNSDQSSPFEDRLIFPIKDTLSRTIALAGRTFLKGDERVKYYNSRESDYFLKRKNLFAIHLAKNEICKKNQAILVEGYIDAVMMHQAGIENVVATMGTSLTQQHFELLENLCQNVVLFFDNDKAGKDAVIRIAEAALPSGLELFVAESVAGKDPAEQVTNDKLSVEEAIKNAPEVCSFYIDRLGNDFFALSSQAKIDRLKDFLAILQKIPNKLKRFFLIQKVAQLTGIKSQSISNLIPKTSSLTQPAVAQEKAHEASEDTRHLDLEENVFATQIILWQKGTTVPQICPQMQAMFSQEMQSLIQLSSHVFTQNMSEDALSELWSQAKDKPVFRLKEKIFLLEQEDVSKKTFWLFVTKMFKKYSQEKLSQINRAAKIQDENEHRFAIQKSLDEIKNLQQLINIRMGSNE